MLLVGLCVEDGTCGAIVKGSRLGCEEWPSTEVIPSSVVGVDEELSEAIKGIRSFCVLWTM